MRNFYISAIAVFMLLCTSTISNAQDFGLLNNLLNQLDSTQRGDFSKKLSTADLDNIGDGLQGSGVMDSLNSILGSSTNPIENLGPLEDEWAGGRDYLGNLIDSTNQDTLNIDALLGEFDNVNGLWNQNVDSLSNIFDLYGGDLDGGGSLDDPPGQDFDSLQTVLNGIDTSEAGGLGGQRLDNIIGMLFSRSLFTDMELAYGTGSAGVKFYNTVDNNTPDLQVVRVGSVPSFETAWEARWHASGVFTNSITTTDPDGNPTTTRGFNPLVMNFDYAVMYNPGFSFSDFSFRYISGLGIEASMLAPSFADNSSVRASNRVGNSVGYGPQLSTGFSITQGDITTYAIASAAFGSVACGDQLDHNFSSVKFEAGVRYSNVINVRYTVGEQSWTADLGARGKTVDTQSQFTVGLILDSLFKN